MAGISVLGTGSYTPEFMLTNQMLESVVDTNDEWITLRTGIKSRLIAGQDESSLSMALAAAERAIQDAGVSREEIGIVVSATVTGDYVTPSLSCLLQRSLGLSEQVAIMDINCACAGFVYALKTAHALLADMPSKAALVVGCEMLSKITDYTDRATCILFGDGAGAAVIRRTQNGEFCFDCGSKGGDELIHCKAQYLCNSPFISRSHDSEPSGLFMNGSEVFRFALETVPESVRAVLDKAGVAVQEVDHFVFHQANGRIIDNIARRLKIMPERCIVNIDRTGNTSSASVAIALDELSRSGGLKRGEKLVISAFGGGLTYASVYFVW